MNKFKRPAAAGAGAAKGAARVKKSKYAGVSAAAPRDPMPHAGTYRFRIVGCEPGFNPGSGTESFKAKLEIVDLDEEAAQHHETGDTVVAIFLTSGKGAQAGLARVKSFVMAASGYEDEDEFNDFDPDGEFIDACESGDHLPGRLVDAQVTRGKDREGGDYYREYSWGVVGPDEGQERIEG